jgi:hypothetical protein
MVIATGLDHAITAGNCRATPVEPPISVVREVVLPNTV